jgi:DNA phosphorothioation-dependent restriction protein DptG
MLNDKDISNISINFNEKDAKPILEELTVKNKEVFSPP